MRLFGVVDGVVDRFDRAQWLTPPFEQAYQQDHNLEGLIASVASLDAALQVQKLLTASTVLTSTLEADLGSVKSLAGEISGTLTTFATLDQQSPLAGSILLTTILIGDLDVRGVTPGPYAVDAYQFFKAGGVATDSYIV